MKLNAVILENFRAFKTRTEIQVSDFTALIGKNDVGKSCILEALEIFFNNELVKIDASDPCVFSGSKEVRIACKFGDLPREIILDETARTTLDNEHLLNEAGELEVHKVFDCSGKTPKESVLAYAVHPSRAGIEDLLQQKIAELKKRIREAGIDTANIDMRSNPAIRQAIWRGTPELEPRPQYIPLDKEDAKKLWETLKRSLPIFALFQADRPSKDEDHEVQDPMKIAVAEAIRQVEDQLDTVKQMVQQKATAVAQRTVDKIKEMDPNLAGQLSPNFKAEPKWDQIFKLTLTGDNDIPVNKRGSGVRRLILLNFFRASTEQRQLSSSSSGIIYAIEEPETSQHPINQRMIVEALMDLASQEHCQILVTTHVPGLAGLLPADSVRYVKRTPRDGSEVIAADEAMLEQISRELGVTPDRRVSLLIFVEGPNDISFLKHISKVHNANDATLPDFSAEQRLALLPLGGSTLQQWVDNRYLRGLGLGEVHLFDRGHEVPPRFEAAATAVNARPGCYAVLTGKREIENYLHPDAITEVFGLQVAFTDAECVPEIVARAIHAASTTQTTWDALEENIRKKKISRAKVRLNDEVAAKMSYARLEASDPDGHLKLFLREIANRLA